MTSELVRVMREQADPVAPAFDPADVLAGGRRRLQRQRVVAALSTTVVVAGAALAGLVLTGPDTARTDPPIATQSIETPSYATGSILILDGHMVEGGGPVTSFVRVPAGTVWTTGDGLVRMLAPDRDDAETIGSTKADDPHLVADPTHDQVAWVSRPSGSAAFVVYDVATGRQRTSFAMVAGGSKRAADQVRVYGVDGDLLYARDSRGVVRLDLRRDRVDVLSLSGDDRTIGSVVGGRLAWRSPVPSAGYVVGTRYGAGVASRRHSRPMLSSAGTYLSSDDDASVHVQRTSDGSVVTPDVGTSYTRAIAYAWSDDDHLLVAGVTSRLDGRRVVDLVFLTCAISTGRCDRTGEGHSYPATLNLPVGEPAAELSRSLRR